MICELKKSEYEKVRPLYEELNFYLITTAVIEGTSPGRIWVDNADHPEIAFLISPEGYFVAGTSSNTEFNVSLKTLLTSTIIPERSKKGEQYIALHYHPDTWESTIERMLEEKVPLKSCGYFFKLSELKVTDWKERIPPGFQMVQVDRNFLKRTDLKNHDTITDHIESHFNSPQDFLQHGIGFCLVHGDIIVSWSLADCVSGISCEIGIATDEEYRRQGFAAITAAATVEYCLSNNFTEIGWHTGTANIGSVKMAEKVGFVKRKDEKSYFSWFHKIDNFIEHGFCSWLNGQYKESAQWYERAIAVTESGEYQSFQIPLYHSAQAICFYAACSWAMAEEIELSFRNLYKAAKDVKNSRQFAERLKTSESLRYLQGTEEWEKLIETLEK